MADRIVVLAGHSEKDIAAAASADGGVRVVPDLAAAVAALDADTRVVLVHDPRWELAPAELITRVVDTVLADGVPAVPVLPCTDTVKRLDERGFVIDTPDRAGLAVLRSPLGWPVAAIRSDALAPGEFPVGARAVTL